MSKSAFTSRVALTVAGVSTGVAALGAAAGGPLAAGMVGALAIANSATSVAHNLIAESLQRRADSAPPKPDDLFHNAHLTRLIGDCIHSCVADIKSVLPFSETGELKDLLRCIPAYWLKYSRRYTGSNLPGLDVHALVDTFRQHLGAATPQLIGKDTIWREFLDDLIHDCEINIGENVRKLASDRIALRLGHALYEHAKHQADTNPAVFAGLLLRFQSRILGVVLDLADPDRSPIIKEIRALATQHAEALRHTSALAGVADKLPELAGLAETFRETLKQLAVRDEQWAGEFQKIDTALETILDFIADGLSKISDSISDAYGLPLAAEIHERSSATGIEVRVKDYVYFQRWLPHLIARETERAALLDFLYRPEPFLWWGIVGEGGTGKSRLAYELISEVRSMGWSAGFLSSEREVATAALKGRLDLWRPRGCVLVVVDYASSHGPALAHALRKLSQIGSDLTGRLRLLLLDRPGNLSNIFVNESPGGSSTEAAQRAAALRFCAGHPSSWGEKAAPSADDPRATDADAPRLDEAHHLYVLPPLPENHWSEFLRAVADRAGRNDFVIPDDPAFRENAKRATGGGRPLLLTVFGLSLLRPGADPTSLASMDELLDEVLESEVATRWQRLLTRDFSGTARSPLLPAFQRVVATITLCRGLDAAAHLDALRRIAAFGESDDVKLFTALHELLGKADTASESFRYRPLEPDLFAERFLLTGGVALKHRNDPKPAAKPFSAGTLIPEATRLAPGGVVNTLQFLPRVFVEFARQSPGEVVKTLQLLWHADWRATLPLVAAAVPEIPATGITENDIPEERLRPYLKIENDILMVWVLLDQRAFHLSEENETNASSALLGWAESSLARRYASFVGAALAAQRMGDRGVSRMFLYGPFNTLKLLLCTSRALPKNQVGAFVFGVDSLQPEAEVIPENFADIASIVAVQAIEFFDPELDWWELDWWGTQLIGFASQWPRNAQIETSLIKGAYNAMVRYGQVKKWSELEKWADCLIKVATHRPENLEVQTYLARRACGAIYDYGVNQQWEEVEQWGARLIEVVQQARARWQQSTEFEECLAKGAQAALLCYGNAGKLVELAQWGLRLINVAANSEDNPIIQEQLASGAVKAISAYGAADGWYNLETWGERLIKVATHYPHHADIQMQMVNGSVEALYSYSREARRDDLMRWTRIFEGLLPEQVENETLMIAWVYTAKQLDSIQRKYPNDIVAMLREEIRTRYAFLEIEKQPPVTDVELIRLYDNSTLEEKQQIEKWLQEEDHHPIEVIRAIVAEQEWKRQRRRGSIDET